MDEHVVKEHLVASFMEFTGCGSIVDAVDHLDCCGWNLDEAVNLFFSIGAGTSGSGSSPPPSSVPDEGDARRRSSPGSARGASRWDSETKVVSSSSRSSRRRRRRQRLRELAAASDNDEDDSGDGSRTRRVRPRAGHDTSIEVDRDLTGRLQLYDRALNSGAVEKKAAKKQEEEEPERSLEDMFRPPRELAFGGGFHDAKAEAARRARWLLVNVQDTTGEAALASLAQNRDVWASELVARFVRGHFVLWQADADDARGAAEAEEARAVCSHYGLPPGELPAVLVVDPVTGQAMARLHGDAATDPNDLLVALRPYIAKKPVLPTKPKKPSDQQEPAATTPPTSSKRTESREEHVTKVEKQSIATAAAAAVAAAPTVEPAPAPAAVQMVCKLRIRLADGRMVTKDFGSGSAVAALFAYCRSELGEGEAGKRPFRLMRLVGSTREEIGEQNVSFEDLGLHLSTVSVLLG